MFGASSRILAPRVASLLLLSCLSGSAWAQAGMAPAWPINDADPSASLPSAEEISANPMGLAYYLMELAERATKAEENKNWPRATKYYEALSKIAPDRNIGPRKLCEIARKTNNIDRALVDCKEALFRNGVKVSDYATFIELVGGLPRPLPPKQVAFAWQAVDQLEKNHPELGPGLRCRFASKAKDLEQLNRCAPKLLEKNGESHVPSLAFAWQRALMAKDWDEAQTRIDQSAKAGVDEATIASMQTMLEETQRKEGGKWAWLKRLLGLLAVGGVGYAFLGRRQRNKR